MRDVVPEHTLIVGVDAYHLAQLKLTWPTWRKHKPSLLESPMVVFYDRDELTGGQVQSVVDHPQLKTVPWPIGGVEYETGEGKGKWSGRQRYKMLAGFIYIPAAVVDTPYWMKLDTDVVAVGEDDWIKPSWFDSSPVIVAHRWSFTKPADQMLRLDDWVANNQETLGLLADKPPLELRPKPGSSRVGHRRIISWCGFFGTQFTSDVAHMCQATCGRGKLPVPSQDGVLFYVAKRLGLCIERVNMKGCGWEHWHTNSNVRKAVERSMACSTG